MLVIVTLLIYNFTVRYYTLERGVCMCEYLGSVYETVFDKKFVYGAGIDTRMQMQKMVYLLERMGMSVGNYNFVWYKHGPYSQGLQDDACKIRANRQVKVNFTERAEVILGQMKEIVEMYSDSSYDIPRWLEAVASLDFIISRRLYNDRDALNTLKEVKPHLNDDASNELALSVCKRMCA